ncbi:MAG: RNA methyltransferase [Flavobacteriales bacterium]|nr:RNA methyltransferase [Flavobacteriales bacterium]
MIDSGTQQLDPHRTYEFLCRYLSARKQEMFEHVVKHRTRHLALVAEDIYQSQNTSSMLRSAECYGIQDVYVIENKHSFQVNRRIAKGAGQWLTLHRFHEEMNNTSVCMDTLRSRGYRIAATSPHAHAVSLDELDITQKTAVMIGTELTGVTDYALQHADIHVRIPMFGFTESLNASVATAIALYRLRMLLDTTAVDWKLSASEQIELKIAWAKKSIQSSAALLELFEAGEMT